MNNILWKPSKESIPHTNIFQLKNYINKRYNLDISDYSQLHEWSIQNIDLFWGIMWENLDIIHSRKYSSIIDNKNIMLGSNWFIDSKLNFSENLLSNRSDDIAIEFYNEKNIHRKLSYKRLYLYQK